MTAALTWLRANFWPVALVVVGLFSFRLGRKSQLVDHQKGKIDEQKDALDRQKKMAGANRHRVPDAISQRLRDGDA